MQKEKKKSMYKIVDFLFCIEFTRFCFFNNYTEVVVRAESFL